MPNRIFRIDANAKSVEEIEATTFADSGFLETKDVHEWLVSHPGLLGEDLLVIQREHVNLVGNLHRADILAVDRKGDLVIVEVKRDEAALDIYWQAALYAASYWPSQATEIVDMFASYASLTSDEAWQRLVQHTGADDADALEAQLNAKQRIVLVARKFPSQVTTTVLWLNEQGLDVSCLQLTLHLDPVSGTHYLQSSYVIPVPETKELMVEVRRTQLQRAQVDPELEVRRNDQITQFMFSVAEDLNQGLTNDQRLTRTSRWAGKGANSRYFKLWYDEQPWANHNCCFSIELETGESNSKKGEVYISFQVYVTDIRARGISQNQVVQIKDLCRQLHGQDGAHFHEAPASFYVGKWVPAEELSPAGVKAVADGARWLVLELADEIRAILRNDDDKETTSPKSAQGQA